MLWKKLAVLALCTQMALIWTHVPWADELQASALARESHKLADWYWNFRLEGHAPLWHLLLKAPLGFTDDPTALKITQSFVVLCSAWLLQSRSPFTPFVKFLLSLNYFLYFEYGVIARSYSLTVFFFFAAIAFRRHWSAWLFIALLPQGGLQSIMLAGICGVVALREQGWKWWGVLLSASGVVVALIWMWPAENYGSIDTLRLTMPWLSKAIRAAYMNGGSIVPIDFDGRLTSWEVSRATVVIAVLGLIGPLSLIRSSGHGSSLFARLIALFIAANFVLAIHVYTISTRHFSLWVLAFIGLLWLTCRSDRPMPLPIILWMAFLAFCGPAAGLRQALTPIFTTSQTAEALLKEDAGNKLIIPAYVLIGAEVNGLLRLPTYNMAGDCLQTFVRWHKPVFMAPSLKDFTSQADLEEKARSSLAQMKKAAARAGGRALILLSYNAGATLSLIEDPELTFLRFIGKDAIDEQWRYLYSLDVPPDPYAVPIPACSG